MKNTETPYTKSLEDELDWKILDQLHSAVSQISGFCFEAKKLCVSIEFVVIGIIATFTKNDKGSPALDHSIFIAAFLIPLCFWFLDSVGYYYQAKLRSSMEKIRRDIAGRNEKKQIIASGQPFIAKERTGLSQFAMVKRACINHSMWLYGLMIVVDITTWVLYCKGVIA